ncbi:hypothetical protein PUN28_018499 [Cardiocondyla obscurior]|uniref:Uncharacterized protein n=1 Tax=Cardiocondyla obscurior TaxID=286306 RepID=A0AAW2EIA2_9HYME
MPFNFPPPILISKRSRISNFYAEIPRGRLSAGRGEISRRKSTEPICLRYTHVGTPGGRVCNWGDEALANKHRCEKNVTALHMHLVPRGKRSRGRLITRVPNADG